MLKVSPRWNASLWGLLSLVAFSGIPVALVYPGVFGVLPLITSSLVGVVLFRMAYLEWTTQTIQHPFFTAAPWMAAGVSAAFLLAGLAEA